jgi:hypothetical protein
MYSIMPEKAQTTLTAHHLNLQIIYWDVLHSKLCYCILFLIRADGWMYHVSYNGQCRYLYCDLVLLVCGIGEYKHIHYFPTFFSDYNDHGAKNTDYKDTIFHVKKSPYVSLHLSFYFWPSPVIASAKLWMLAGCQACSSTQGGWVHGNPRDLLLMLQQRLVNLLLHQVMWCQSQLFDITFISAYYII